MNIDSIRQYIRTEILNDPEIAIGPDDDLLLNGLIDSLGVTRLVVYLEAETKLTIPPEDVTLENFSSLSSIDDYLKSRRT